MFFQRPSSSRKSMFFHFFLNLLRCIRKPNSSMVNRRGHFHMIALQSREKLRMKYSWFLILNSRCNIPCHPKIRVLINSLRDQTRNICSVSENMRKSITKSWNSLHRGVRDFSYIITSIKSITP